MVERKVHRQYSHFHLETAVIKLISIVLLFYFWCEGRSAFELLIQSSKILSTHQLTRSLINRANNILNFKDVNNNRNYNFKLYYYLINNVNQFCKKARRADSPNLLTEALPDRLAEFVSIRNSTAAYFLLMD